MRGEVVLEKLKNNMKQHFNYFSLFSIKKDIKQELEETMPRVTLWHDTAQHLMHGIHTAPADRIKTKLQRMFDRLNRLQESCLVKMAQIDGAIGPFADVSIPVSDTMISLTL